MNKKNMPIGFFDSGVGGLSVMKEAIKIMPNENYIYFGDSQNAPYGVKSVDEIKELTFKGVQFLLEKGAKGIVVACNTATSAAVAELRLIYPNLPLVGIEPAIKPAVKLKKSGKILMMATPMTVKQEKFKTLLKKYESEAEIIPISCDGLMEFVEHGVLDGDQLEYYLKNKLYIYMNDIGSIVLGCTHYPFVKDSISKIVGEDISIIDGGEGTVREIRRRLDEKGLLNNKTEKGEIKIYNSLNTDEIINLSWKLILEV